MIAKHGDFKFDASLNWQAVEITQKWCGMVGLPLMEYNAGSIVLSYLELVKQAYREIYKQRVTVVDPGQHKCQHKLFGGGNKEDMSSAANPAQFEEN